VVPKTLKDGLRKKYFFLPSFRGLAFPAGKSLRVARRGPGEALLGLSPVPEFFEPFDLFLAGKANRLIIGVIKALVVGTVDQIIIIFIFNVNFRDLGDKGVAVQIHHQHPGPAKGAGREVGVL
jgi:hypothetical protein